eukprot:TRINITY_DN21004_c0_g1_i1.p1 TRINITY_DN21004_c0_g1~~TRINITY_DN21004_c0_g1_i1.p1  ORF type:complete len:129 (-),score=16.87 TRINITY_DN21004_c0_g1_i1:401-787(-)
MAHAMCLDIRFKMQLLATTARSVILGMSITAVAPPARRALLVLPTFGGPITQRQVHMHRDVDALLDTTKGAMERPAAMVSCRMKHWLEYEAQRLRTTGALVACTSLGTHWLAWQLRALHESTGTVPSA